MRKLAAKFGKIFDICKKFSKNFTSVHLFADVNYKS